MYPLAFGSVSSYGLLFPFMVAVPITFCLWRLTRHEGQSLAAVVLCFTAILAAAAIGAKLFSLGLRDWQVALDWRNELVSGWRWAGLLIGVAIALPLSKRFLLPRILKGI